MLPQYFNKLTDLLTYFKLFIDLYTALNGLSALFSRKLFV